jgi:hypothetical protein
MVMSFIVVKNKEEGLIASGILTFFSYQNNISLKEDDNKRVGGKEARHIPTLYKEITLWREGIRSRIETRISAHACMGVHFKFSASFKRKIYTFQKKYLLPY